MLHTVGFGDISRHEEEGRRREGQKQLGLEVGFRVWTRGLGGPNFPYQPRRYCPVPPPPHAWEGPASGLRP